MYFGILALMTPALFTLWMEFSSGDVVTNCQEEVNRTIATEDNFVEGERQFGEPVLFGPPFEELLNYTYEIDHIQRVFECIADKSNAQSRKELKTNENYKKLMDTCISKRPQAPVCNSSYEYRMINGACNNIKNPNWGRTHSCFRRLYPANYEGVSGMRKSVVKKRPLPEPRIVSLNILKPKHRPIKKFNSLFVFFGQAVAHDLAEEVFTSVKYNKSLDCCKYAQTNEQHPQCAPIFNPSNDPLYSSQNVTCLNCPRMAPCYSCNLDKRIQISQVTSYIDCSNVYGQTEERSKDLRIKDGKLESQYVNGSEELLPGIELSGSRCGDGAKQEYCLKGGDTRINQHALLSMMQTLLLREHNRVAVKLKDLNPRWDDEKLFQEARKILIAEFQVIVYEEYLPILIGQKVMKKRGLRFGRGSRYDSSIDPSISMEFDAAAFRIHSIIPGEVVEDEEFKDLRDLYVNVVPLYEGRTSPFFSKMANHSGDKYDRYLPIDLTFFLYREQFGPYGYDLGAVDIQRGRDVGLPTYPQVIEYRMKRKRFINDFHDLLKYKYIDHDCLLPLRKTYRDVRDVDFWVGLNCEPIPHDMIISPTAADIIAEQFRRAKFGDRFYIEHDPTLTDNKRQTLMKASLAKLICDNTKVEMIQREAMLFPHSRKNPKQPCSDIPGVDLNMWKEK